jgi:uncharacterized protein YaaQ
MALISLLISFALNRAVLSEYTFDPVLVELEDEIDEIDSGLAAAFALWFFDEGDVAALIGTEEIDVDHYSAVLEIY